MSEQYKRRRMKNTVNRALLALLSFVIVVAVAAGSVFVIETFFYKSNDTETAPSGITVGTQSVVSDPEGAEPVTKVTTATVAFTGDLFMHMPIITNAELSDGTYSFDNIFTYFTEYTSQADYTVASLETTLSGTEDGNKYGGNPQFNCPDEIVDAASSAGIDMLLTANKRSYDTRLNGMTRTLQVIDEKGLDRLGTIKDETEKKYTVKNVNGIKIGMLCYTLDTDASADKVVLGGTTLSNDAKGLINTFSYGELDGFYQTVEGQLNEMKTDGAETTVLFIRWGEEYETEQNDTQEEIAQKLCDLGVDVIIGGGTHAVQPIELLTSETDPEHKTVCLYSMGSAVSNLRREYIDLKTGHTEDGVLFEVTFAKYSDGTVRLEDADVLPTWVNMFNSNATGKRVYQIIPLDSEVGDWKQAFDLTDSSEAKAKESLERTEEIVEKGLKEVQDYLLSEENAYPKTESQATDMIS